MRLASSCSSSAPRRGRGRRPSLAFYALVVAVPWSPSQHSPRSATCSTGRPRSHTAARRLSARAALVLLAAAVRATARGAGRPGVGVTALVALLAVHAAGRCSLARRPARAAPPPSRQVTSRASLEGQARAASARQVDQRLLDDERADGDSRRRRRLALQQRLPRRRAAHDHRPQALLRPHTSRG